MQPLSITSHRGTYHTTLGRAEDMAKTLQHPSPVFIIDPLVARLHKRRLAYALKKPHLFLAARETNKTLQTVSNTVLPFLMKHTVGRSGLVVAIGGGIVQDTVAFAASIFMRGIPWALYPTTLLGQADSCIGSKTSINYDRAKNLVGTFYPAQHIIIDSKFLATLSDRDFISGVGEIVKVHLLAGKRQSRELLKAMPRLLRRDPKTTDHAIYASLIIKKKFIEKDEFDDHIRNLLNYGHGIGHALEAASNYKIPHGIGVFYGMAVENRLSVRAHYISRATYEEMDALIAPYLLQATVAKKIPFARLLPFIKKDKKNIGSSLAFILPHGFGRMKKHLGVNPSDVERAWNELLRGL